MKEQLNPKFILGYTDTDTVMLDFDNATVKDVRYWALRSMKWFKLRGFIILRSSENCYHVVFDRSVTWAKNIHIMNWVAVESQILKLKDYALMQGIKESSTLRIGPKNRKPSPALFIVGVNRVVKF